LPGIDKSSFDRDELEQLLNLPRGSDFQSSCMNILERLVDFKSSWPFLKPVKKEEVPDYYDVIKFPMDFVTMREKIVEGKYKNREQYISDIQLICDNARVYNTKNTIYFKCATELEKYAKEILVNLRNENKNEKDWEANYLSDWTPPQNNPNQPNKISSNGKSHGKNTKESKTTMGSSCIYLQKKGIKFDNGKSNSRIKKVKHK
jgi:hypothetical protein